VTSRASTHLARPSLTTTSPPTPELTSTYPPSPPPSFPYIAPSLLLYLPITPSPSIITLTFPSIHPRALPKPPVTNNPHTHPTNTCQQIPVTENTFNRQQAHLRSNQPQRPQCLEISSGKLTRMDIRGSALSHKVCHSVTHYREPLGSGFGEGFKEEGRHTHTAPTTPHRAKRIKS
jgi:hypothetical protein